MAEPSWHPAAAESVAVIGLACRFPDADDPPTLLDTILTGRRAFRRLPPGRLDLADYDGAGDSSASPHGAPSHATASHATASHATASHGPASRGPRAGLIEGWQFDRESFRIPAQVYAAADPAHWLALETAARALAAAGFPGGAGLDRDRIGVVIGNTLAGDDSRASGLGLRWPQVRRVLAESLFAGDVRSDRARRVLRHAAARCLAPLPRLGEHALADGGSPTIPDRISSYFGFRGGSQAIDSACASSLQAVASACAALTARDIDVALAGGVDLSLDPLELIGLAAADPAAGGDMRIYDENPTGYLPGEGCGVVVLMRTAQARAAGLPVYAEIVGWGTSAGGMPGVVASDASSQLLALRRAYERAGVDPCEAQLIEGHGSGTAAGDEAELTALAELRADARQAAALGSIKANIGHAKAAAGAAGLIKAVLALGTGVIPPTTGVVRPHPLLRGADAAFWLPAVAEEWPAGSRLAGVSAMGVGGVNVHLVLRNAPGRGSRYDRVLRALPRLARAGSGQERAAAATAVPDESRREAAYLLHAPDRQQLAAALSRVAELATWLSDAEMTDLACQLGRDARNQGPVRVAIVASRQEELARLAAEAVTLLPGLTDGLITTRPGIFAADNADGRVTLLLSDEAGASTGPGARLLTGVPLLDLPADARFSGPQFPSAQFPDAQLTEAQLTETLFADTWAGDPQAAAADPASSPAAIGRSLAALRWLESLEVSATAAVGHGLGEIAGLAWAGVLSEADVTEIAALRAEFLSGPAVRVLAPPGRHADSRRPAQSLSSDALDLLRAAVAQFRFGPPRRRLISTRTGRELASASEVIDLICGGFAADDRLAEAVTAGAQGATLLVETGPGRLLASAAARACRAPAIALDGAGADDQGQAGSGRPRASQARTDRSRARQSGAGRASARRPEAGRPGADGSRADSAGTDRSVAGQTWPGQVWAGAALFAAGAVGQVQPLLTGQPARPIDIWRDRVFITGPGQGGPEPQAGETRQASPDEAPAGTLARPALASAGEQPPSEPADHPARTGADTAEPAASTAAPWTRTAVPLARAAAQVAPADGAVTPAGAQMAPADGAVTPAGAQMAPADGAVTPAGAQATPADGTVILEGAQMAPADGAVTPAGAQATLEGAPVARNPGPPAPAAETPARAVVPLARAAEPPAPARGPGGRSGAAHRGVGRVGRGWLGTGRASGDRPGRDRFAAAARATGSTATGSTPTDGAATDGAATDAVPAGGTATSNTPAGSTPAGGGGAGTRAGVASWARCFTEELRPPARPLRPVGDQPWRIRVAGSYPFREEAWLVFGADPAAGRALAVIGDPAAPGALQVALSAAQDGLATGRLTVITTGPGLAGFAATLHAEHPEVGVTVLRVPASAGGLRAARRYAHAEPGEFRELVLTSDGTVREAVLTARDLPGGGDFPLGPSDVALVSRSSGGAALALAQVLACCGAAVAVVGRAEPGEDSEVVAGLEELRLAGARIAYEVVDTADPTDMALAVQRVERRLGPVTAVAHAVGPAAAEPLAGLTQRQLGAHLGTERTALHELLSPVQPERLRLVLTFGSVAGHYGLPRQGLLAAASAVLADQGETLAAGIPGCVALHVQWPGWSGGGLGDRPALAASMAAGGTAPITVSDAARLLLKALATPGLPGRIAVHGRIGEPGPGHGGPAADAPQRPLAGRFLQDVVVHYPGIELVCDAWLSLATDPYLADYRVDGLPVLPPVMAMEALAQAAAALAGRPLRRAAAVTVTAPVVLPAGGGRARIRVCALVEGGKITAVLRCEESGFAVDHVRAQFALDEAGGAGTTGTPGAAGTTEAAGAGGTPGSAGEPLAVPGAAHAVLLAGAAGLVDGAELYGPVCFQSGRFRRIAILPEVTSRSCRALARSAEDRTWFSPEHPDATETAGAAGAAPVAAETAAGDAAGSGLLLGSPGLNDTALQVLQACVPDRRVWLESCASVWFSGRLADGAVEIRAVAAAAGNPSAAAGGGADRAPGGRASRTATGRTAAVPAQGPGPDQPATAASELTWDVEAIDSAGEAVMTWRGVRVREAGLLPRNAAWPPSLLSVYLERGAVGLGLDPELRITVQCGQPGASPAGSDEPLASDDPPPSDELPGGGELPAGGERPASGERPAGTVPQQRSGPLPAGPLPAGPLASIPRASVPADSGPLAAIPGLLAEPGGGAVAAGTGLLAGFTLAARGAGPAACGWAVADPQHPVWPAGGDDLAATFSRLCSHLSEPPVASAARLQAVAACLAMAQAPGGTPVTFGRVAGDGWALLEAAGIQVACVVVEISGVSCPVAIAITTGAPRPDSRYGRAGRGGGHRVAARH